MWQSDIRVMFIFMEKAKTKLLKIENLSFSYTKNPILEDINLELDKGEIAALIGTSGSGKSTLFKLIVGILEPHFGTIYVSDLPRTSHHVAYMMQEDLLLPWRTILSNLTLVGELGKTLPPKPQIEQEALALLNDVGLAGKESLYPDLLSGGMRQRVSLARALLQKRPLLLLDEPFGSLDIHLRDQMYSLLRKIHSTNTTTTLLVTHDFRDALSLADTIYHLSNGRILNKWKVTAEMRQDIYAFANLQNIMKNALGPLLPGNGHRHG